MEGCPEGENTVLTREQAKKQPCPLMPTTKSYEYHANGTGIAYEVIEYGKCTGEECPKWSCYPMWEQSPDSEGLTIYRPLMGWTLKDVVAIHQRHGLNLNPLYGMGFERVGCLPCINSSKNDIRITAQLFPWAIEKIRHWEEEVRAVSRLRRATFFHAATTPGSSGPAQIDEVVLWSKTLRGGKQYDIRSLMEPSTSDVCIYAGGLNELNATNS